MEELSMRIPLINQLILKNLDDKSLANFKENSRKINQVMNKDKSYWITMLNKHSENFKEFKESWNKVIFKNSVDIVKKLALHIDLFFKNFQKAGNKVSFSKIKTIFGS